MNQTEPAKETAGEDLGSCKVRVTITGMRGRCSRGLKVGQTWVLDGFTPAGMCEQAYLSIAPVARIYRYGGRPPADRGGYKFLGCVDPRGPIFELRKIPIDEPDQVRSEKQDKC